MVDTSYLHLSIGPSGDFHNHVQDRLLFVGIERNIVERRDGHSIFFDKDTVFEGVGRSDLPYRVASRGIGVVTPLADR